MYRLLTLTALVFGCPAPVLSDAGVADSGTNDSGLSDAGTPDAGLPDVRATTSGPVRGQHFGASLVFKGLPYAGRPQRWMPPQAPAPWAEVKDTVAFGPPCVQVDSANQLVGDEDCLSLNVWTPYAVPDRPLPVLVFVHGGNNQIGCSCDGLQGHPYFDGQYLSEHGPAVVVTLNYRLAAFGFLAHPAFALENDAGSTGDYGLLDQLFALQWVQDNVAVFGGDRAHVMVFGHSAGSEDVAALVASPLGAGLFSRAGLQSGPSVVVAPAAVVRTWTDAENATGCDGGSPAERAACLRGKSTDAIARLPGAVLTGPNPDQAEYNPTLDARVLPQSPLARARAGQQIKVPMLIGTTSDEYTQLIDLLVSTPITDDATYQAEVQRWLGASFGATVITKYPSASYATPRDAFVAILNDVFEICPTRQLARAYATASGQPPLYRFIYTHTFPGALAQYRAAHAFDIYLLFHDLDLVGSTGGNAELSDLMARYWTRFAATGDPNGGSDLAWSPYGAGADSYQQLDWPPDAGAGSRAAQCDFWEANGL
jgi:para-nitrobenzyl esterase